MRALFCVRQDYNKNFAGDSMQIIKTAEYLERFGISVDINNGGITNYSKYDIVHLFNLTRMAETYKYFRVAQQYKKKIVLSPIYWNLKKYYIYKNDLKSISLWEKCRAYRAEIVKGCSMIYPNSTVEGEVIQNDFGKSIPYTVVYNGIEVKNEEIPLYNFKERYNLSEYALCVGRICPRKNQLTLAKICNQLGITLVLIGNVNDKVYFEECMKYKNVVYLGFMDSYNIYEAYKSAQVHILPSFVETPGLTSLEAAASGCSIISTEEGSAREYFKDMALYCNPYDEQNIYDVVKMGFKQCKNQKLRQHILENYNWERCIKSLYESYRKIGSQKS